MGYFERHHIIPRCLGGKECSTNIVNLTPEEHYVAHQLLAKIYPENAGLVWAALQMSGQPNGKRNNNKIYGWLKKRWSTKCKERTRDSNGSFGRGWYYNPDTRSNIKCFPDEVPKGYKKGRINTWNPPKYTSCKVCGNSTGNKRRKYCEKHRKEIRHEYRHSKETKQKMRDRMTKKFNDPKTNPAYGKRWIYSDEEKRSRLISKNQPLPSGWKEGRRVKF